MPIMTNTDKTKSLIRLLFIVLVASTCLISCSTKPKIVPRSEIIKQAKSRGLKVKSIQEENSDFFSHQRSQEKRLVGLLKARFANDDSDANYQMGAGDELEIYVFDVPDLNTTVRVRDSGYISLPLIGAIEAKGRTETELVLDLVDRLKTYVRNPQVSVFITNYASQKVSVMGAVTKPGSYSIKKGQNSLSEFLSRAGGLNDKAGNFINFLPSENKVSPAQPNPIEDNASDSLLSKNEDLNDDIKASLNVRDGRGNFSSHNKNKHNNPSSKDFSLKNSLTNPVRRNGDRQVVEIDVASLLGTDGGIPIDIPLKGGDMIIVPEAGGITIEGEVAKPGSRELIKGMTLVSGLAAGEGITYAANITEVELVRKINKNQTLRYVVNLEKIASGEAPDVLLRNGDVVRVPSHPGRRIRQDTFDSITRLINFGVGGTVPLR